MVVEINAGIQQSSAWRKDRWAKRSPDMSGKRKGASHMSPGREGSVSKTVSTASISTSPSSAKKVIGDTPLRGNSSLKKADLSSTGSSETTNTGSTPTKRRVTFQDHPTHRSILEDSMESSLEEEVIQKVPSYARRQHKYYSDTEVPSISSMGTDSYERRLDLGEEDISYDTRPDDSYEEVVREFRREEGKRQRGRKFFVENVAGKLYIDRLESKPKKKKLKKRKKKKKRRPRYMPQPPIEEEFSYGEAYSLEEGYSVEGSMQDDYVKQQLVAKQEQKLFVQQNDGFYMETRTLFSISTASKSNTHDDSTLSTDGAFPDLFPVQEVTTPTSAPRAPPVGRWQKTAQAREEAQKQAEVQMPMFSEEAWYTYQAERDNSLTLKKKKRKWLPRFFRMRPKRLLRKIRRFMPRLRRRKRVRVKKYQGLFESNNPDSFSDMATLLSADPQVVVPADRRLAPTPEVQPTPEVETTEIPKNETTPPEEASTSSSEMDSIKQKRKISYVFPKTMTDFTNSSPEDVDRPSVTLKQHLKRIGVTMNSLSTILEGSDRTGSSSRSSLGKTSSRTLSHTDSSTKSLQQ